MSASSSVKTGIQARMNRIEQRDRVKQSKTRKSIAMGNSHCMCVVCDSDSLASVPYGA